MVTDDVGFDVLVTQACLEQWLVDNGLVPTTYPPTTPLLAAWGHVSLHGMPTQHCVDGTWVDAPSCRVSPCKAAGVSFAIVELDQYVSEARLERAKVVDALDRLTSRLGSFVSSCSDDLALIESNSIAEMARLAQLESIIQHDVLNREAHAAWGEEPLRLIAEIRRAYQALTELAQRSRANLVSPAFHVTRGRGRRQVPLLDAITQHLCKNGFSYGEVAALIDDGIPGDEEGARERVRKRAANPERRSLVPSPEDSEPSGNK